MSTPTPNPPAEPDDGGPQAKIAVTFNVTAAVIAQAVVAVEAKTLADAALTITEEEPNKAVAVLLGSALEMAAAGMQEHAYLALQSAVHLTKSVLASRALGVVG